VIVRSLGTAFATAASQVWRDTRAIRRNTDSLQPTGQ
jgi:hypothetical protein